MLFTFLKMFKFIFKDPIKKMDTGSVSLIYQTHVVEGSFILCCMDAASRVY